MECAKETPGRRPQVFRDPANLQVPPEAYNTPDLQTSISRLAEATKRLSTHVTSQADGEAVAAELRFIEQTVHGIRSLTHHPTCHWPYR
jgi:hypothetical protein